MTERSAEEAPTEDGWFAEGVQPLRGRLLRYIATLVPVRADADDLLQKTLLTAWQERARFEPGRDLFAWLCGVARNHVRRHFRTAARSRTVLDPDVVEQLADRLAGEDAALSRRHEALTGCLNKLPAAQRELVERFYRDGRTVREFAAATGAGAEALYKSLQRIRAALHDCITATLAREDRT